MENQGLGEEKVQRSMVLMTDGTHETGDADEMDIHMDTEFHGLGIHINFVKIGNFEGTVIHCTRSPSFPAAAPWE
mgnify:CR=1 FL=1